MTPPTNPTETDAPTGQDDGAAPGPTMWDAGQVADAAGYAGAHRNASARKLMSRLGVEAVYVRNAVGRPVAHYPADQARLALDERTGHPTGGGRKPRTTTEAPSQGPADA